MAEYKRVREQALLTDEEIVKILDNAPLPCPMEFKDEPKIRADDQSLPSIELFAGSASMAEVASMLSKSVDIAGQLREAGFIKVVPKEE